MEPLTTPYPRALLMGRDSRAPFGTGSGTEMIGDERAHSCAKISKGSSKKIIYNFLT